MDIVLVFNGLGNQMSQFAFYLSKKRYSKRILMLFDSTCKTNHNGLELKKFGIGFPNILSSKLLISLYHSCSMRRRKVILNRLGIRVITEPKNYDYSEQLLKTSPRGINFYWGGWHSELYFISIENEIKRKLSFPSISSYIAKRWENLINKSKNSVSIHVRRGDYLHINNDDYYQFGDVATIEYYKNAINKIQEIVGECIYFVFSDDIDWCKDAFGNTGFYYVEGNIGESSWIDMFLMSICNHHIIANSTFSWWSAWLGNNPNSVIIRPKWFIKQVLTKDFYPSRWIEV